MCRGLPRSVAFLVALIVGCSVFVSAGAWAQDDLPPPPEPEKEVVAPPPLPPQDILPPDDGVEVEGETPPALPDLDQVEAPDAPEPDLPPALDVGPMDFPADEPLGDEPVEPGEQAPPGTPSPGTMQTWPSGNSVPTPPPPSPSGGSGSPAAAPKANSSPAPETSAPRDSNSAPADPGGYEASGAESPLQPGMTADRASQEPTASTGAVPRPASYRRRTRAGRSLARSLPTVRDMERVAKKSVSPALYLVGFALLGAALVIRLRAHGSSVESLRRAADVESLLTLVREGSPVQRERGRDALLGLLTDAAERQDVDDLVSALRCSDTTVQSKAAATLCALDTPEAIVATANAVRDYTERLPDDLRSEMMERLAQRDHSEVTETLLDGLHDRAPTIREIAYAHLYARVPTLKEQGATRQLARVMRRGDADLSAAALSALGESGSADAVAPLQEFASDYSLAPELRADAVRALCSLPPDEARAALRERLADFYPQVREAAQQAIPDAGTDADASKLDSLRESATSRLYEALTAHLEGRRAVDDQGQPVRWEDEALELGQQLQEAGGRDLVYAVFHDLNRRLQDSHGRSPRMLRLLWQQRNLW